MADFEIFDRVKIVRWLDTYNGKTGVITNPASKQQIPTGFRELGKGFKTKEGQQQWVVALDDTNETTPPIPEINLEKIP